MYKLEESVDFKGPLKHVMKHVRALYIMLQVVATLLVVGLLINQVFGIDLPDLPDIVAASLFALIVLFLLYVGILCLIMAYSGFVYAEVVIAGELITSKTAYLIAIVYLGIGAVIMYMSTRILFYTLTYIGISFLGA